MKENWNKVKFPSDEELKEWFQKRPVVMSKINWTEPMPPINGKSNYDHVTCDTPLGECKIEWKGWKESPDYEVEINGDYIATAYGLGEAKSLAVEYLFDKFKQLKEFLNQ